MLLWILGLFVTVAMIVVLLIAVSALFYTAGWVARQVKAGRQK